MGDEIEDETFFHWSFTLKCEKIGLDLEKMVKMDRFAAHETDKRTS